MSIKRYTIGFVLSVALTLASFGAVWLHQYNHHSFPTHQQLMVALLAFALVQLAVQLVYFLHLGRESKARDILSLAFAVTIVVFVVGGSLWIMSNLRGEHDIPYDGAPSPQTEH